MSRSFCQRADQGRTLYTSLTWLTLAVLIAWTIIGASPALAAGHGSEEDSPRSTIAYERIYGLTINIFQRSRVQGQLIVSLNLESHIDNASRVRQLRPRLRDSYNRRLLRFGQSIVDTRRPLDIARLEQALQNVTDDVLGSGKATVLLHSALISR